MRDAYEEIRRRGAEVVAIGTGDLRYARAFVDDERIPFPVLVDDDGRAAAIAAVKRGGVRQLVGPRTLPAALKATAAGHRQHRLGKRPRQLGATFVIGPGAALRYRHLDADVADHAPLEEILAALDREPG